MEPVSHRYPTRRGKRSGSGATLVASPADPLGHATSEPSQMLSSDTVGALTVEETAAPRPAVASTNAGEPVVRPKKGKVQRTVRSSSTSQSALQQPLSTAEPSALAEAGSERRVTRSTSKMTTRPPTQSTVNRQNRVASRRSGLPGDASRAETSNQRAHPRATQSQKKRPPMVYSNSEPIFQPRTPKTLSGVAAVYANAQAGGSTPLGATTQNEVSPDDNIKELRDGLWKEFGEKLRMASGQWVPSLYHKVVSVKDAKAYLKRTTCGYRYSADGKSGRWHSIPQTPKKEREIHDPMVILVRRIVEHFSKSSAEGVTRTVVDTSFGRGSVFRHDNHHLTYPDISIRATGPSFEVPGSDITGTGYTNVASILEIKMECGEAAMKEFLLQVASYCRQIFIQQPNRNFVRCLIITQKHVRLIQFDRSGHYISPLLNIHEDPITFIRLIAGLSSTDESVLGLDTSVQWEICPNTGKKLKGTVMSLDRDRSTEIPYPLRMDRPPTIRSSIHGRGTTCWYAKHPREKIDIVIKDSWRSDGRRPEYEYLLPSQGIHGVVVLVSFQDKCGETNWIRIDPDMQEQGNSEGYCNRIKLRLVMEQAGLDVSHFKSRYQFISAMRDAILAHCLLLWKKEILHRDIAINNLLLGGEVGPRGLLIDLDMAIWADRNISEMSHEPRTGRRLYQSVSLIGAKVENSEYQPALPHDYLDDLESFFYVMSVVVFGYSRPGVKVRETPDFIKDWETGADKAVAHSKQNFINGGFRRKAYPSFWGEPCKALFNGFKNLLSDSLKRKEAIRLDDTLSEEQIADAVKTLIKDNMKEHYTRLGRLFDDALVAITAEDLANSGITEPVTPSSARRTYNFEEPASPLAKFNAKQNGTHGSLQPLTMRQNPRGRSHLAQSLSLEDAGMDED